MPQPGSGDVGVDQDSGGSVHLPGLAEKVVASIFVLRVPGGGSPAKMIFRLLADEALLRFARRRLGGLFDNSAFLRLTGHDDYAHKIDWVGITTPGGVFPGGEAGLLLVAWQVHVRAAVEYLRLARIPALTTAVLAS